jgi:hypothetical protein
MTTNAELYARTQHLTHINIYSRLILESRSYVRACQRRLEEPLTSEEVQIITDSYRRALENIDDYEIRLTKAYNSWYLLR